MTASEKTNNDRVSRDLLFFALHRAWFSHTGLPCDTSTLNAFGRNTSGITSGSFSLLCLILSLYYTVLDSLCWKKIIKKLYKEEL